ncbi:hypothetical protein BJ170DRAFT_722276 [Xylariales sp. AK1849]|nr:hypothetical protein BJ170DRAFT_722276 [Xylariales sp. AK1849]
MHFSLASLPVELILSTTEYLDDPLDVYNSALTCKRIWSINVFEIIKTHAELRRKFRLWMEPEFRKSEPEKHAFKSAKGYDFLDRIGHPFPKRRDILLQALKSNRNVDILAGIVETYAKTIPDTSNRRWDLFPECPLRSAIRLHLPDCVDLLLSHNYNPEGSQAEMDYYVLNKSLWNPLREATYTNQPSVACCLVNKLEKVNYTNFLHAVMMKYPTIVHALKGKQLMDKHPISQDEYLPRAFRDILSLRCYQSEMVDILIDVGMKVDVSLVQEAVRTKSLVAVLHTLNLCKARNLSTVGLASDLAVFACQNDTYLGFTKALHRRHPRAALGNQHHNYDAGSDDELHNNSEEDLTRARRRLTTRMLLWALDSMAEKRPYQTIQYLLTASPTITDQHFMTATDRRDSKSVSLLLETGYKPSDLDGALNRALASSLNCAAPLIYYGARIPAQTEKEKDTLSQRMRFILSAVAFFKCRARSQAEYAAFIRRIESTQTAPTTEILASTNPRRRPNQLFEMGRLMLGDSFVQRVRAYDFAGRDLELFKTMKKSTMEALGICTDSSMHMYY